MLLFCFILNIYKIVTVDGISRDTVLMIDNVFMTYNTNIQKININQYLQIPWSYGTNMRGSPLK